MMDSQENALTQGTEEVKAVEGTSPVEEKHQDATTQQTVTSGETEESQKDNAPVEEPVKKVYATKKEVIERLKEIVANDETPQKAEIDLLKTTFYKLHFAEREAQQKAFIENGGTPETYQVLPDEDEEVFKAEMGVIKEKRQKAFKALEDEKLANLKKKLDIIEKIKTMATTPEEANRSYQDFKALQQEWKEIKPVPADKANELWRNYQLYVEQYYDLLNLNREAREYDFKKNLEKKTALCEAAEKLATEEDVISAFHQLQDLHQQYRETGPVAKELREEIWARFKAASTVVNKRHQQHFEELRAKEEENLEKKTALCEKVEAVVKAENKTSSDWETHTQEIIEIQKEWKTIGFAPQKMNVKIFERFRSACDDFFTRKGEYFKNLKAQYADEPNITLLDSIYDLKELFVLRSNANCYLHGHSAGGTNPSLVEAMFFDVPIIAFDVVYNRETTFETANYFSDVDSLVRMLNEELKINSPRLAWENYTWNKIRQDYLNRL